MEIIISTCNRTPAYIHQTLASFLLAGGSTVSIVMDSEVDLLPEYSFPQLAKYCSEADNLTPRMRAANNYFRCLLVARAFKDVLICEDDIVFFHDTLKNLQSCIVEIEAMIGSEPYVISLSENHYLPHTVESLGKSFVRIHQEVRDSVLHLATPLAATYYSATFDKDDFLNFMRIYALEHPPIGGCHDISASWYWHLKNIHVFNIPLVMLIGEKTSIPDHT
jgi:hypothetical protein